MSAARDLLVELQSMGIELRADGDRLRIKAPKGLVTDDLRRALADRKGEIIDLLSHRNSTAVRLPFIWHFYIDGKRITAIDYERRTYDEMLIDMQRKFGAERVQSLEPQQ